MIEKISYNHALITLIPGGSLVSVIYLSTFFFFPDIDIPLPDLDILNSFIFLALSLTIGEIIQTVAHGLEFVIDWLYFKGYRPSEIFLSENNPIISNRQRKNLIELINLSDLDKAHLKKYDIEISFWKRIWYGKNESAEICQNVFWSIYRKAFENPKVQHSNARYLFARAMFLNFFLTTILFATIYFSTDQAIAGLLSIFFIIITYIFLYRARGCGKGLVKEVIFNKLY